MMGVSLAGVWWWLQQQLDNMSCQGSLKFNFLLSVSVNLIFFSSITISLNAYSN